MHGSNAYYDCITNPHFVETGQKPHSVHEDGTTYDRFGRKMQKPKACPNNGDFLCGGFELIKTKMDKLWAAQNN